jgi:DNA-binding NtrC family response regulator
MATTHGIERKVLVVDPSVERVRETVTFLQAAGYQAVGATSFDAARNLLSNPPDVLISAVRLRSFNGLHLILHGRFLKPDMVAVVVADNLDPFLAAEAAKRGVAYLVRPLEVGALLALISAGLEQRPVEGAMPEDFMAFYRDRRAGDRRHASADAPGERRVGDRRHASVVSSRRLN